MWVLIKEAAIADKEKIDVCENTLVFEQKEHAEFYANTYEHSNGFVPKKIGKLPVELCVVNWTENAKCKLTKLSCKINRTKWDEREFEWLSDLFPEHLKVEHDYSI